MNLKLFIQKLSILKRGINEANTKPLLKTRDWWHDTEALKQQSNRGNDGLTQAIHIFKGYFDIFFFKLSFSSVALNVGSAQPSKGYGALPLPSKMINSST